MEKGWHWSKASLVSMRRQKFAQSAVKLLDRAVSKGLGMVKGADEALASVSRERLEGGADAVGVASPWWSGCAGGTGGINSGGAGGGGETMTS